MIAGPTRTAAAPRSVPPPAVAAAGDDDTPEPTAIVDARLAALVARLSADDEALERRTEEFDQVTRMQAEIEREMNALRDMAMEQMKKDDENLKKWIELI
jgi:hypothetical protein